MDSVPECCLHASLSDLRTRSSRLRWIGQGGTSPRDWHSISPRRCRPTLSCLRVFQPACNQAHSRNHESFPVHRHVALPSAATIAARMSVRIFQPCSCGNHTLAGSAAGVAMLIRPGLRTAFFWAAEDRRLHVASGSRDRLIRTSPEFSLGTAGAGGWNGPMRQTRFEAHADHDFTYSRTNNQSVPTPDTNR